QSDFRVIDLAQRGLDLLFGAAGFDQRVARTRERIVRALYGFWFHVSGRWIELVLIGRKFVHHTSKRIRHRRYPVSPSPRNVSARRIGCNNFLPVALCEGYSRAPALMVSNAKVAQRMRACTTSSPNS